jgi:hypothetical protein
MVCAIIGLMLIVSAASFAGGMNYERAWRKAQLRRKTIRLIKVRKRYDGRV